MKIKKNSGSELLLEVKSISWLGLLGTLSIWTGIIYSLIFQPILLGGKLDIFAVFICLILSLFCLLGLVVSLSIDVWSFNNLEGQFMHSTKILSYKKTTKYHIPEIKKIELEKIVPNHDDVGGVKWCVYCRLISSKKIEIYCHQQEEYARKIAQAIQEHLR